MASPILPLTKCLLKYLINKLLLVLSTAISAFLKVDENLILFTSGECNTFAGNSKYLFEALSLDVKLKCYWITKNKALYHYLKKKYKNILYLFSIKTLTFILKAKYFIATHNNVVPTGLLPPKKTVIQTWHGTPLKSMGHLQKNFSFIKKIEYSYIRRCNYLISPSTCASNLFSKSFKIKLEKCPVTGNPRNDILFKELDRKIILEKIGIDRALKFKKIILYCPTFRDNSESRFFPFKDFDLYSLNDFLEKNKILCILRNHYYDTDNHCKELSQLDRIEFASPENFTVDVQELLAISDILITDYSSLYFDFLLLDRPIVFIPYDYKYYNAERGFLLDYSKHTPGYKVKNFQEFKDAIKNYINDPKAHSEERLKINKLVNFFCDANSVERVKRLILNT